VRKEEVMNFENIGNQIFRKMIQECLGLVALHLAVEKTLRSDLHPFNQ